MRLDHWKNYAPIERVTTFDDTAAGPATGDLQVIANTHASDSYPDARIGIVVAGVGSAMLTLEQSAALRGHLERAERAVRAGGPAITTATGAEGCCEACGQLVHAGDLVYAYEDVTVHAGPCLAAERGDD